MGSIFIVGNQVPEVIKFDLIEQKFTSITIRSTQLLCHKLLVSCQGKLLYIPENGSMYELESEQEISGQDHSGFNYVRG